LAGFPASQVQTVVRSDGQHAEWFWRREFQEAYQWLKGQNPVSTLEIPSLVTKQGFNHYKLRVVPNPCIDFCRAEWTFSSEFLSTHDQDYQYPNIIEMNELPLLPPDIYWLRENLQDALGLGDYFVIDLTGRTVAVGKFSDLNRIDVTLIENGNYFLYIKTKIGVKTARISKLSSF